MSVDVLVAAEQKRFIGREFLTWLVYTCEETGGRFEVNGEPLELVLGDRVVLEGGTADRPRLTVVGQGDTRPEIGAGLQRGKLLDRARLTMSRGERRWELTLDGGLLTYDSLRCPTLGDSDTGAQADPRASFENDLFLRLADMEDVVGVLDRLFADFCRLRGSSAWPQRVLPALRAWVDGLR